MSWKDLSEDQWRPCTICGHTIKKQYRPSSWAGAMFAAGQNVGCENTAAVWHQLIANKKFLLQKMTWQSFPQSIIDELKREITELETKIPKPVP